jgi:uncharacterized protein
MNQRIESHSVWQTIGLHLVPGALITVFYFLGAPLVMQAGYPALMDLLLAILVILMPFELGCLLIQGRRQSGRLSLKGVVLNRESLPPWQYFVLVPLLLGWCAFAFSALAPLDDYLARTLFSWLPAWSMPSAFLASIAQYSRSALMVTVAVGIILNGIAAPVVEELYFRGYLLPRIPASRAWAPLINVLLFSMYHFFSPWQNITRIVALIPLVYVVAWKRNIYLGVFVHCLVNTVGMLSLLARVAQ